MKVTVKFAPHISALTKTDQVTIELNESTRLSGLLGTLAERYGKAFMDRLYASETDSVDVWASLIVNGKTVSLPLGSESDIELKEGWIVVFMAPASGG